jgi:NADH:ubiquinone oxidoreductase subunit D
VSVLPYLLKDTFIPDIVAIMGSLDFVVGDIDR